MHVPDGSELSKARKARGLTQAEVAKRADVSQPLLSRVENDDIDPRLPTLHRVAQAINDAENPVDYEELEVAIPSAIMDARIEARLTQSELANQAGVSQPLIARIENNNVNPRASTLQVILQELDPDTTTGSGETEGHRNATNSATESETRMDADANATTSNNRSNSRREDPGTETGVLKKIEDSFKQL